MVFNKRGFKRKIMNDNTLFSLVAKLINLKYLFYNKCRVNGKKNQILKGNNSIFRKVKILISGSNNYLSIGSRCIFRNVLIEINGNNNKIELGNSLNFMEKGYLLIEGDNCIIKIGDFSLFRDGSFFAGESNTRIEIGPRNFCGIVTFSTSDFHSVIDLSTNQRINLPGDIIVGDNNWMSNYVSVRKGAVIANNSIIAPYSIITKRFEQSNVMLAGQTAKVIKENVFWSREKL